MRDDGKKKLCRVVQFVGVDEQGTEGQSQCAGQRQEGSGVLRLCQERFDAALRTTVRGRARLAYDGGKEEHVSGGSATTTASGC
mgnify:CR=1 FL=1